MFLSVRNSESTLSFDPRLDLKLKVFIDPNQVPLLHTARSLLRNQMLFSVRGPKRKQLTERSSSQAQFLDTGVLEKNDHIRLENIRLLFANAPLASDVPSKLYWLRNLSFQIDAMSVYERLIRDYAEGAFGPSKGLTIKILSFLHHGLFSDILNIDVRNYIIARLFSSNDLTKFSDAIEKIRHIDCKRNRYIERRNGWIKAVERLTFLPNFSEDAHTVAFNEPDFLFFSIFYNMGKSPKTDEIDKIMGNPMYLMGELEISKRIDRALNVLTDQIHYFMDGGHDASEAIEAIDIAKNIIHRDMSDFKRLQKSLGEANHDYATTHFYGGLLYEYENLNFVSKYLQSFLPRFNAKNGRSRIQFMQVIVITSEALNGIFLPLDCIQQNLPQSGIPSHSDVVPLRNVLVYLRNKVLEHPLLWQLKKLEGLLNVTMANTTEIFLCLRDEMRVVKDRISYRLAFIERILKGKDDWREILDSMFGRYLSSPRIQGEPGTSYHQTVSLEDLKRQQQWQVHPLEKFQALRRYFLYRCLDISTVLQTDSAALQCQMAQVVRINEIRPQTSITHKWEDLYQSLKNIKTFIGSSLRRDKLLARLQDNLENRLEARRLINHFYRILRQLLETPSTSNYEDRIKPCYRIIFEYSYLDLRDLRNFHTHDLWRPEDLNQLTNNLLRTITIFDQALNPPELRPVYHRLDPIAIKLRHGVKSDRLSPKDIRDHVTTRGLDVDFVDHKGLTLLYYAVRNNNQLVVRTLLELGSNPHKMDGYGDTVLHHAVSSGYNDLSLVLLEFGALTDTRNHRGQTVVDLAIECSGSIKVRSEQRNFINLLKNYDSKRRENQADALHDAIRRCDIKSTIKLLGIGHAVFLYNKFGELPLAQAVDEQVPTRLSSVISTCLLQRGALIDQKEFNGGNRALWIAAQERDPGKASLLLSNGAQVNLPDEEPILSRSVYASTETLALLLSAGAPANRANCTGQSPLLWLMNSLIRDSYPKAKALLEAGADPNGCDGFGTVLHNALERNGSHEAAIILLDAGAAPFVKGWGGLYLDKTPIDCAISHLNPLLNYWINTKGRERVWTLHKFMAYLPWSDLWKKKLIGLYNGVDPDIAEGEQMLVAFDGNEYLHLYVTLDQKLSSIIGANPVQVANIIINNIGKVKNVISNDVIEDKWDLIDSPLLGMSEDQLHEIKEIIIRIERTKKAIKIYKQCAIEDYDLTPDLTSQQIIQHPLISSIFIKAFQMFLDRKRDLAHEISETIMQPKNKELLQEYIVRCVGSGRWLETRKLGVSGILQAYSSLVDTKIIVWDLTMEPGEFDLQSISPSHASNKVLNLMHVNGRRYGRYYVLHD